VNFVSSVYEQQDAAEFFQKIMNMVNQEMSKVIRPYKLFTFTLKVFWLDCV